ncbi:hypothetical protein ACQP1G_38940 [Nocardia sp. CA-107356]
MSPAYGDPALSGRVAQIVGVRGRRHGVGLVGTIAHSEFSSG